MSVGWIERCKRVVNSKGYSNIGFSPRAILPINVLMTKGLPDKPKERFTVKGPEVPMDKKLPDGQYSNHYILSPEERKLGYIRPFRESYTHNTCKGVTSINTDAISETFAVNPFYYKLTFCCHCKDYYPVEEFKWVVDGERVGS